MSAELFTKSKNFKEEYSCRVTRLGQVHEIPETSFLAYVIIGGETVVIRKDQLKEGDLVFYVTKENVLRHEFCSNNNLYMYEYRHLNSNVKEVDELLKKAEECTDEKEKKALEEQAKRKCGFFQEHRRVRAKVIRGVLSAGYIFSKQEIINWRPELEDKINALNLEDVVDIFFDEIAGEEFCHVYVPKKNVVYRQRSRKNEKRREKKLHRFDRIIPGEFEFHYDTCKLGDHIWRIKPDDVVTVTTKIHGTSAIISHVKCNFPLKINKFAKFYNKVIDTLNFDFLKKYRVTDSYVDYDVIYSSRGVIKNQYINENASDRGFYKTDVWEKYYTLLKDYIPKGMALYGEIYGYETGITTMIQKHYDYGCAPGTNKIMFYRITTDINLDDKNKYEWNVSEVHEWTLKLLKDHPELKEHIEPIDILYHGKICDLYPQLDLNNHWHENLLISLKNDKERFGMELDEPLCNNKVPREGIVVRIDNDPVVEAFKLKTDAYALREQKAVDAGEVDIEMANTNYSEEETENVES